MCNNLNKKTTKKICLVEGLSSIGFSFTIYNVFGDDLVNLKIYLNVKSFSWIWVKENQLYIKLYFKNKCIYGLIFFFWFYYIISRSKIIKSNIVSYGNYLYCPLDNKIIICIILHKYLNEKKNGMVHLQINDNCLTFVIRVL